MRRQALDTPRLACPGQRPRRPARVLSRQGLLRSGHAWCLRGWNRASSSGRRPPAGRGPGFRSRVRPQASPERPRKICGTSSYVKKEGPYGLIIAPSGPPTPSCGTAAPRSMKAASYCAAAYSSVTRSEAPKDSFMINANDKVQGREPTTRREPFPPSPRCVSCRLEPGRTKHRPSVPPLSPPP
jgi:hypothetical protein